MMSEETAVDTQRLLRSSFSFRKTLVSLKFAMCFYVSFPMVGNMNLVVLTWCSSCETTRQSHLLYENGPQTTNCLILLTSRPLNTLGIEVGVGDRASIT